MTFTPGQFYMAEMPHETASDAAGRSMAISSVRKRYQASPTFKGNPAMLVVLVPQDALTEASQLVRDALGGVQ